MNMKKIAAVIALAGLVVAGSFAQLAIGASGSIYSDTEMSFSEAKAQFQNGEGVFYGGFLELGMGKMALGVSGNFSFYDEDWSYFDGVEYVYWTQAMMDYDVALYLQGHLFRYRAFLDPFLEAGIGMMATDYANSDEDPSEDPLRATLYFQAGGGLGINLGGLGIFAKVLYMFPTGSPMTSTYEYYDPNTGSTYQGEYTLEAYPLKKLKVTVGAKLIL